MALSSRFGTSTPEGKTTSKKKVDRLAEQATALAGRRPSETTVESMEQASIPGALQTRAGNFDTLESPASTALGTRSIDAIRPSPFQPRGRPSSAAVEAVGQAIIDAGSLDVLVGRDGALIFNRLGTEAVRLAELAYSIRENGVKDPIEIRIAEDGIDECLSGHRRLAAARLAGLKEVPVLQRGRISSAQAAAMVLNGNLHREGFTPWQEAVLVSQVQERRKADDLPADVRTLGSIMGWSAGKVHHLLKVRSAYTSTALSRIGHGNAIHVEEGLARLQPAELKRLVEIGDVDARDTATRRVIGFETAPQPDVRPNQSVCALRPKRQGGFVIEVRDAVEQLGVDDAVLVYETLAMQLARVRTRLNALGHAVPADNRASQHRPA